MEKHGIVVELPLTCGTCDKCEGENSWLWLRWCASCGEAICPTCYPASEDNMIGRCSRCVAEDRPTGFELAGREMARKREEAFIKAVLG